MNETINGILIGSGITLVTALVTSWLNQKGETRRLKKQLKYECLKEEINELRDAFNKFKEQIWQSYKEKFIPIELFSEVLSLYPEEIRKEVFSLMEKGLTKELKESKMDIAKIFAKMNEYIVKRRKEIIKEI